MQAITTIGLDIAKSVFQIHGVDAAGNVVIRRRLKRCYVLSFFQKLPPCLIGIEACASSHHWSRELQALPTYVKPYVKRHKTHAADAEAICEAVIRETLEVATFLDSRSQAVTGSLTRRPQSRSAKRKSASNYSRRPSLPLGNSSPFPRPACRDAEPA